MALTPEQADAKANMLADVFAHFFPNLDGREPLDAMLDYIDNREDCEILRAAWSRARIKRDLAKRGLELPDYSLRGIA